MNEKETIKYLHVCGGELQSRYDGEGVTRWFCSKCGEYVGFVWDGGTLDLASLPPSERSNDFEIFGGSA